MSKSSKRPIPTVTKPVKCLTDEELQKFLDAAPSLRTKFMILLMADAGLRIGEMLKLKWSDLFFAGEPCNAIEVTPRIAKNKRPRTIPVTERLHDIIQDCLPSSNDVRSNFLHSFVFAYPGSINAYTARQVQRVISNLGKAVLQKRVTPHMLRHTFATRLMRKCPMRVVQYLLGHASMQSTQIYTHPNSQDYQNAIDSLNKTAVTAKTGQP